MTGEKHQLDLPLDESNAEYASAQVEDRRSLIPEKFREQYTTTGFNMDYANIINPYFIDMESRYFVQRAESLNDLDGRLREMIDFDKDFVGSEQFLEDKRNKNRLILYFLLSFLDVEAGAYWVKGVIDRANNPGLHVKCIYSETYDSKQAGEYTKFPRQEDFDAVERCSRKVAEIARAYKDVEGDHRVRLQMIKELKLLIKEIYLKIQHPDFNVNNAQRLESSSKERIAAIKVRAEQLWRNLKRTVDPARMEELRALIIKEAKDEMSMRRFFLDPEKDDVSIKFPDSEV